MKVQHSRVPEIYVLKIMKTGRQLSKLISGFTLVELLVVMGIIGILAGMSIFALQGARESARDARRKGDLETIATAL